MYVIDYVYACADANLWRTINCCIENIWLSHSFYNFKLGFYIGKSRDEFWHFNEDGGSKPLVHPQLLGDSVLASYKRSASSGE